MGICESSGNTSQPSNIKNPNQIRTTLPGRDTLILNNDVIISNIGGHIDDVYKKIKLLGEGSYGKVWLVLHEKLGKEFALKIIKRKGNKDCKVDNEIKILTKLDHPFILKIIEFHSTSQEYHIITDYCSNVDLYLEINK